MTEVEMDDGDLGDQMTTDEDGNPIAAAKETSTQKIAKQKQTL